MLIYDCQVTSVDIYDVIWQFSFSGISLDKSNIDVYLRRKLGTSRVFFISKVKGGCFMIDENAVDFEMSQEELDEFIMKISTILQQLEQETINLKGSIG